MLFVTPYLPDGPPGIVNSVFLTPNILFKAWSSMNSIFPLL